MKRAFVMKWSVLACLAALLPAVGTEPVHAEAPVAAKAEKSVAAPQFVRELGGIQEYRLANGLQILLFPDEAQNTTTVNITYRVGSRFESQGEYGMAHLLEHMLFKGTPRHRDIPDEFAKRGMRFNGSTTADRTNYFGSFNADANTLAYAIDLEADRMVHSFIAKADLDKEMTVVRNEFERGENQPMQVLSQRVTSVSYDWHPYGHATIGPKSDIENVPIERLLAFYKRFYRPDNATVLVAGRFDTAAALQLIARAFGPIARPKDPIPAPYTTEPAHDGERSVVVRRVGGQPVLQAYYHVPAMGHPDTAALLVYEMLMSMEPAGHLYKSLVETKLAVGTGMGGLGGFDPGGASALAVLPPQGEVDKVEKILLDQVEGREGAPFTEDELKRVRDLALLSHREQMKNPEGLIQQISTLLGAGDWRLIFQLMDDLPKVTLADVERVRKAYFRPANRTLGRYLPAAEVERVSIPPAPPLAERLAQLKPPPKVEAGEVFEPTPAALQKRTQAMKLPSGIQLWQLPKQTRGNTVTLQMQLRWADLKQTLPLLGTSMIGELMFEGSEAWDKQRLRDELVRLKADMNLDSGNQGVTLQLTAEKDTLIDALKVAAELMQHPRFPADDFERIKQQHIASLEASRQDLNVLRSEVTRVHYNAARGVHKGELDYIEGLDEDLDEWRRTTLADVRSFYQTYWSAQTAEVAVVGAIPPGFAEQLDSLFGHWKKPEAPAYVRHVPSAVMVPAARFDVQADDKTSAILKMKLNFALNHRDADYLPLMVAVHVLGGGGLETRLSTHVRREQGLSYGVGAGLAAPDFGQDASLTISATYAPQNRERIIEAIRTELARMSSEGVTAAELERARKDVLESWMQSRAKDSHLASALIGYGEVGLDWRYEAEQESRLKTLSLEQVNAAWRRFIQVDGFVTSTAGDFKALAR